MEKKVSVLFVCQGNVIRSPLCEGLCRTLVTDDVLVDSAAIYADEMGNPPRDHAQTVAAENGYDISAHRSRIVCDDDFVKFTSIVALDRLVYTVLQRRQVPNTKARIIELVPGHNVTNPYSSTLRTYRKVFAEEIKPGVEAFIKRYIPKSKRSIPQRSTIER